MRGSKEVVRHKIHVKKGDTVVVLAGKDKGKIGKVIRVLPKERKVVVEDVNVVVRHLKRVAYGFGGRVRKPNPIDSSNVMLVCPRCGKPTRIRKTFLPEGKKARECKKCGEIIDE